MVLGILEVESQICIFHKWRMNDFLSFCLFLKFFSTVWSLMYQPSTAYFHLQQKLNWKWKFFEVIHNTERNQTLGWSLFTNWSEVICTSILVSKLTRFQSINIQFLSPMWPKLVHSPNKESSIMEFDYFVIIIIRL